MTFANFAVAVAAPRFTRRIGNPRLLAAGIAVTLIGMAWLCRLSADGSYLASIALPMIMIGAACRGPPGSCRQHRQRRVSFVVTRPRRMTRNESYELENYR
jgi:cyanate permease